MTSAAIPGTGQTPEGKPEGYGNTIVSPTARKKYLEKAQPGPALLRRSEPNNVAEETGAYGNAGEGSFGYQPLIPSRNKFAGSAVFEVSSHTFHNAKMEKRKGKHWRTYLDECDELSEIREYANKNPKKAIVLQNRNTNEMVYVRYGKAR